MPPARFAAFLPIIGSPHRGFNLGSFGSAVKAAVACAIGEECGWDLQLGAPLVPGASEAAEARWQRASRVPALLSRLVEGAVYRGCRRGIRHRRNNNRNGANNGIGNSTTTSTNFGDSGSGGGRSSISSQSCIQMFSSINQNRKKA